MRYLLDADVLAELLRPAPCPFLLHRIAVTPSEAQVTSAIAIAELLAGAYQMDEIGPELARRLEDALRPNVVVMPFDAEAASVFAKLRRDLAVTTAVPRESDVRTAAIAVARECIVVTHEARRFDWLPELRTEDWLA